MVTLSSNKNSGENLSGSKLVLLEGSSLGSRRHHHGGASVFNDPPPRITNNQNFDGLGSRRHHHGGASVFNDPPPRITNNQNFDGLGSRRHFRKFTDIVNVDAMPPLNPDNLKTFETIFDSDGKPMPLIDPMIQRKIEKTLLGNQWSGVFPSALLGNEMVRKRFFKMISNKGGYVLPKRYTGGVMPRFLNPKGNKDRNTVPVDELREVYKERGLLGELEADEMSGVELLGMANVIRVAMESPNPDADLYLLGEIERIVEEVHGDIFGNEDLLGAEVMPELRRSLSDAYVNKAGFLRGTEFDNMNDGELLGFFKAIGKFVKGIGKGLGKVAKGVWKGVKGAGKFVGKVGKGAFNLVKKGGAGLWKGIKGAGKFVGNVVKTIGKGALDVGKFALKNAGGLLKAGLSFIPGGGIAAGLLDLVLPEKSGEQEQQQSQEQQYAPPVYTPQMSNDGNMYPPQQYTDPNPYIDPSMYEVAPEQVFTDPTQYEYVTPEQDQQLSQEYYEVANDPNQEEMTQGEAVELLGNFFKDVGKFLKKGVKKVGEFALNNPELLPISQRDMLYIGNKFQQGAQFKSQKNAVNENAGMYADMQNKQLDSENKIGSNASNMLSTYALPIGVALIALMLIMKK